MASQAGQKSDERACDAPVLGLYTPADLQNVASALEKAGFVVELLPHIRAAVKLATQRELAAVVLGMSLDDDGGADDDRQRLFVEFFGRWFPEVPLLRLRTEDAAENGARRSGLADLRWPLDETSPTLAWLKAGQVPTEIIPAQRLDGLRALARHVHEGAPEVSSGELMLFGNVLAALDRIAAEAADAGERAPGSLGLDEATLPVPEMLSRTRTSGPPAMSEVAALLPWASVLGEFALAPAPGPAGAGAEAPSGSDKFEEATLPVDAAAFIGSSALQGFSTAFESELVAFPQLPLYTDPFSRVERVVQRFHEQEQRGAEEVDSIEELLDGRSPLVRAMWMRLPPAPTVMIATGAAEGNLVDVVGLLLGGHLRLEKANDRSALQGALDRRQFSAVIVQAQLVGEPEVAQAVVEAAGAAPVVVVGVDEGQIGAYRNAGFADVFLRGAAAATVARGLAKAVQERSIAEPTARVDDFLTFMGAPEEGTVLLGSIGEVLVPELLLALHLSGRTAVLEVVGDEGPLGTAEVVSGQLVFAEAAVELGEEAVQRLAGAERGWFRVSYDVRPPRAPNIAVRTPQLLIECLKRGGGPS